MGTVMLVTWASSAGAAYGRQRERRYFDIEFLTGQRGEAGQVAGKAHCDRTTMRGSRGSS
jgi:hypothetical protein